MNTLFRFFAITGALWGLAASAQVQFSSGSNGGDGELRFHTPPSHRGYHLLAFHEATGKTIMYGGYATTINNERGDTWSWDGTNWTEVDSTRYPSPRSEAAFAYDADEDVIVMFGGFLDRTSNETDETWEWDGTNWTQIHTSITPPQRQGASMAYFDTAGDSGEIVMFGGLASDGTTELNDTWVYDGTNWQQKFPATSPPVRAFHESAFDAANAKLVMYGGTTNVQSGGALSDTWTYDGTTWTELGAAGPGDGDDDTRQRWRFSMTYHSGRNTVVTFGGVNGDDLRTNELWEFDGTQWSKITVVGDAPPGRVHGAIAYDSVNAKLVMFGGQYSNVTRNDTWLFDGTTWTAPRTAQANPVIDLTDEEDNPRSIYHYTDIVVPSGVTVSFLRNATNTPVVWLASGDVTIDGTVTVAGADGTSVHALGSEALPGPGGFAGGLGGERTDTSQNAFGTPGIGPGGGRPSSSTSSNAGGDGSYSVRDTGTLDGAIYGNAEIVPLVGGSGGGGGGSAATSHGGGGGAGGGAILIAASGSISVNGTITADGGVRNTTNGDGGHGSGGAIKLVANTVSGNGDLLARGARANSTLRGGRVRIESYANTFSGSTYFSSTYQGFSSGTPETLNMLDFINAQPSITVTSIAGQSVDASGSFSLPEVAFSDANAVTIELATQNVPVGTTITLRITTTGDQRGSVITATSTPVVAGGAATASVTLPSGVGSVQAYTTFTAQ